MLFSLGAMNSTCLPSLAAIILTSIIIRDLARKFPARAASPGEYQALHLQYHCLQMVSQVAALVGIVGSIMLLIGLHIGNTPWLLAAAFGLAVLTPVSLIAAFTLPRGVAH